MSIPLFVSERPKPKMATRPLSVACLVFEKIDQIDFTGPFEVLSRMPETTIRIVGKELAPVRDIQGLRLLPDVSIGEAGLFDVLLLPGGHGQQALMHDDARHLMRYYGAVLADARVVVDGNLIIAVGVTVGLDGAPPLASLLRGDGLLLRRSSLPLSTRRTRIFDSGTPKSAPTEALGSFQKRYRPIGSAREKEAMRYAATHNATQ